MQFFVKRCQSSPSDPVAPGTARFGRELGVSMTVRAGTEFTREETELIDLLHTTIDSFFTILSEKQQSIDPFLEHKEAWLEIDPTRFTQVLTNLISNTSKYSPNGSQLIVRSAIDGDSWTVCVEDNGRGIAQEDQAKLFNLFYRTPDALDSATSGTGIGLFISKQIVDLHGGQNDLRSVLGEGTTVTLSVPSVRITPMTSLPGKPEDFSNTLDQLDEAV